MLWALLGLIPGLLIALILTAELSKTMKGY